MPTGEHSTMSRSAVFAASLLAIAALYLGREVLIPLTLSILFAFLLNPLVARLKRWGVPHLLAVLIVGVTTLVVAVTVAAFLMLQLANVVQNLPSYRVNLAEKLHVVWDPVANYVARATETVADISEQKDATETPVTPVRVVNQPGERELLAGAFAAVAAPIGILAVVLVLAGAMLVYGADLRDRVVRLIGDQQIPITTGALNDAGERVSRYLLIQTLINGSMGVVLAIGMTLLGLPNGLLWGLLWAMLRFIPYIGPWLGALAPIITALGYFQGWYQPMLVISLFVVVELATNLILEPWLYGSGTGLSPVAVLASAVFWTWLWGWVGLLLATPLTVCLAVLGRYVPPLEWLHILLGDEPVLPPHVRLYQRLIADQSSDARQIVAEESKRTSLAEAYENVVVPALIQVDIDERRDLIDEETVARIYEIVDELLKEAVDPPTAREVTALGECLCVPAQGEADVLCARMLKRILAPRGITLTVVESGYLASEKADLVSQQDASVVLVSALGTWREAYLRHTLRRIADRNAGLSIIGGLWGFQGDRAELQARAGDPVGAIAATSFTEALDAIRFALTTRLERNRRLGLTSPAPQPTTSTLNGAFSAETPA